MSCSQEQLWSPVPECHHNWVEVSQWFEWRVEEPSKAHVRCRYTQTHTHTHTHTHTQTHTHTHTHPHTHTHTPTHTHTHTRTHRNTHFLGDSTQAHSETG